MRTLLLGVLLLLTACQQLGESISLDEISGRAKRGDRIVIGQLVGLLGSDGELTNDRVYAVLVALDSAAVVPVLLPAVTSKDRLQREYVIAALGNHQAVAAVEPLTGVLADQTLKRRYVAAWALGEIADSSCVPPLLSALADPETEVRKAATRALIKLNRLAVEPLIDFLPSADRLAAAGSIRVLGDIADPRAFEVLAAQVDGEHRVDVMHAFGKLKAPQAEPLLVAALADQDWQVRMHAAMALSTVGTTASVAPLEQTLEDGVKVVREWSARSLEAVTGKRYQYRNEVGELVAPYNIYH
jgi:HEAT repeat protein